jgi:hypothetical protein
MWSLAREAPGACSQIGFPHRRQITSFCLRQEATIGRFTK